MKHKILMCCSLAMLSMSLVACGKKDTTVSSVDDIASSVLTQTDSTKKESPTAVKSGVGEVKETEATTEEQTTVEQTTAVSYITPYCTVTGNTVVPERNMDGSSCKAFFSTLSTSNFNLNFGSSLSDSDLVDGDYSLVGTDQIKNGDLHSTGWLISNLSSLSSSYQVYFTNLHVIGSFEGVSSTLLLCSYDWYSAYGMKDTLVLFEDISGTLSPSMFKDGDIISTVIVAKNIKVETVNGQNIVHVEYATK